ncbi:hypothetical protein RI129_003060 [Pyrocoelia pectoralis]|uniref:DDE Tnp4 domain-containing protein n=1 Tax=Pyrocoelia pectoralis TaxID=417401 RepID=A0AAN7VPJ5_9COLE
MVGKPWLDRNVGSLNLANDLSACRDLDFYKNFLRMDETTFNILLKKIEHRIQKNHTNMRESIPAIHKLIITLRYLATGESYRSLMYNFRVSESTISLFVPIVCQAIYEELKDNYLKVPSTVGEWLQISHEFEKQWNLPNVIGALDGKHIQIKAQGNAGSAYYNYKHQHSIVLLALVDADYTFTYINVGVNGRISDGGVFRESDLYSALTQNSLNIPADKALPKRIKKVPYVIVADAAFQSSLHILKPYPFRNMTRNQRIFNYRLSRVRRIVENTFGILANRFRILLHVNALEPQKVCIIVQAACALHNFLRKESSLAYIGTNPEEDIDRRYALAYSIRKQLGNRASNTALAIRDEFTEYVNGVGSVEWQENMF